MDKEKDPKRYLTEEDIATFRQAMKHIRPLKSDKIFLHKKASQRRKNLKPILQKEQSPLFLSDYEREESVTSDQKLFYVKGGISPKQIRKLKHGKFIIEATLDLHGNTATAAKEQLIQFIQGAHEKKLRYICIIHGKGHLEKPILKNKVNNWLRQLDFVLAFCTAQPKHGGTGAIYILLKS